MAKCNRDSRCLSLTYWGGGNNKCYTKSTSHANDGKRIAKSRHHETYMESCVDRPRVIYVPPPPPPPPKVDVKCLQERMDTLQCDKKCQYESPKDAEIGKLKCELKKKQKTEVLEICKKERDEKCQCERTCPGEGKRDGEIFGYKC